jgi:5-methylcytosine-specific restriction endonuclease McrA
LPLVAEGALHVSGVCTLGPHLREDNAEALLAAACHLSRSALAELLAAHAPRPEPMPGVRAAGEPQLRLTAPVPEGARSGAQQAVRSSGSNGFAIEPVSSDRFTITVTVDRRVKDKLAAAQALLSHAVPSGDEAEILERALDALLEKARKKRFAETIRPQPARQATPGSRYIPAAVKRQVVERDGGQCSFVGQDGRRCTETAYLEIHHVVPFAQGGPTTVDNTALLCKAHNAHVARVDYGRELVADKVAAARRERERERAARTRWHEELRRPGATPALAMNGLVHLGLGKTAARALMEEVLATVGPEASVETLLRAALRRWPGGARERVRGYDRLRAQ